MSVLIPCWNAASSIERAVWSALVDSSVAVECVVVDDASTDGTAAIVDRLAATDTRLVAIHLPSNVGVSAARNRGLEVIRGTWLTLLDADDEFLSGGLAGLMARATASDALAVIGQQVWTDGHRTWRSAFYERPDILIAGRKSLPTHPGLLYFVSPHAKLFHRSIVEGLRFEGRVLGDQPWVIRALLRAGSRLEVIDRTVYLWRRPPPGQAGRSITSTTRSSANRGVEAAGIARAAFASVAEAALVTIPEATVRDRFLRTYAERLLSSDLGMHLSLALDRGDPALGSLLEAIGSFVAEIPPAQARDNTALTRWIVVPPLRNWDRLSRAVRPTYWDLLRTALTAQPDLARHAGDVLAKLALRAAASELAAGRGLAVALLLPSRFWHRLRRGLVSRSTPARRRLGPLLGPR